MTRQLRLLEPDGSEWRLDDETRAIGRRGLAAARAALRHADRHQDRHRDGRQDQRRERRDGPDRVDAHTQAA